MRTLLVVDSKPVLSDVPGVLDALEHVAAVSPWAAMHRTKRPSLICMADCCTRASSTLLKVSKGKLQCGVLETVKDGIGHLFREVFWQLAFDCGDHLWGLACYLID